MGLPFCQSAGLQKETWPRQCRAARRAGRTPSQMGDAPAGTRPAQHSTVSSPAAAGKNRLHLAGQSHARSAVGKEFHEADRLSEAVQSLQRAVPLEIRHGPRPLGFRPAGISEKGDAATGTHRPAGRNWLPMGHDHPAKTGGPRLDLSGFTPRLCFSAP